MDREKSIFAGQDDRWITVAVATKLRREEREGRMREPGGNGCREVNWARILRDHKKGVFAAFAASREETVFVPSRRMRVCTGSRDPGPVFRGALKKGGALWYRRIYFRMTAFP